MISNNLFTGEKIGEAPSFRKPKEAKLTAAVKITSLFFYHLCFCVGEPFTPISPSRFAVKGDIGLSLKGSPTPPPKGGKFVTLTFGNRAIYTTNKSDTFLILRLDLFPIYVK